MKKYEHLFFDLDRTLWDFDTNSRLALNEIYLSFDLKNKGILSAVDFVETYQEINEELWALYRKGLLNKRKLRTVRFTRTLEAFEIDDEYLGDQLGTAYVEISPHKTALLPNTIEILDYLKGKYQLHIITNGFEEVQHVKLEKSGLSPYFDKVITSEQVGARKPDPTVFHYALESSNCGTSDSLMIGDDLGADIIGAREVGMDQVYFNPNKIEHSEELDHEIVDLIQLKQIL
ncbi:MAG: YjjG family noncanonical pyrimidine nucleotidase [Bacteroidota bacterium]